MIGNVVLVKVHENLDEVRITCRISKRLGVHIVRIIRYSPV